MGDLVDPTKGYNWFQCILSTLVKKNEYFLANLVLKNTNFIQKLWTLYNEDIDIKNKFIPTIL